MRTLAPGREIPSPGPLRLITAPLAGHPLPLGEGARPEADRAPVGENRREPITSHQFWTHFEACNRAVNCSSSRRAASDIAGVGAASAPSTTVAKPLNDSFNPANFPAASASPCCFAAW